MEDIQDWKNFEQLNINWFPGHMRKALRGVRDQIKRVDVVIELRDARLPMTSQNPDLQNLFENKSSLIIFNKSDLADPNQTQKWESKLRNELAKPFLFVDVKRRKGLNQIIPTSKRLMQSRWENLRQRGIRPPVLRLMVIGIPNVGKSSLINALARRRATQTGPKPGVTRHQEWIVLGQNAELLDTPGILWPKIQTTIEGLNLTLTGAIKDEIIGVEILADYLIQLGKTKFPQKLLGRYRIENCKEVDSQELLHEIARKRGFFRTGGNVDVQRVSEMILHDFREGLFGPITFDVLYSK
jgi:ribosome biogenesis GTPase A